MKRKIVFSLFAVLLNCFFLSAAVVSSGKCGTNLTWTLDNNGVLTISGTGNMKDYSQNVYYADKWAGSQVYHVIINSGVTNIGRCAFYRHSNLISVSVPNSVTSIGVDAFNDCTSLASITIPNSVTSINLRAFHSCRSLTSVTIPNSVTSIGENVFEDCSNLTSVTIPHSVTSISSYTFQGCSSLASIVIPNTVTSIGMCAFAGCSGLTSFTIPSSVTSIGVSAFGACELLDSIYISDICTWCDCNFGKYTSTSLYYGGSVFSRNHSLFLNGSKITNLIIPNSVSNISLHAFEYCNEITSVTIPSSVTKMGAEAFYCCDALTSVIIQSDSILKNSGLQTIFGSQVKEYIIDDGVTQIGSGIFNNCDSVKIFIPNSVTTMGYLMLNNGSIHISNLSSWCNIARTGSAGNYSLFLNNNEITNLIIPSDVTGVGTYAFSGCNSITSVIIPNSVTSIGDNTFSLCRNLTSVSISNSVTSIGGEAFSGCSSLKIIAIPNSVSILGDGAFIGCGELESVTIGNGVTCVDIDLFKNCTSLSSVTFGSNIKEIKDRAFKGCGNIKAMTCISIRPPSVTESTAYNSSFEDLPYSTIVNVPAESYNAYLMHNFWGKFILQPIDNSALEEVLGDYTLDELLTNPETQVFTLQGGDVTIRRNNLPTGVYIVRLGNKSGKVVVQ